MAGLSEPLDGAGEIRQGATMADAVKPVSASGLAGPR